jgi:hypothetical protein
LSSEEKHPAEKTQPPGLKIRSYPEILPPEKIHLAAELTGAGVSVRAGIIGAEREGSKAAINEVGFGWRQLTGAATNQDSVLVIHTFSFHHLDPVF